MKKKERIYGLDILRTWAILLVVSVHGVRYLPETKWVNKISNFIHIDGVTLFFVLSGFLIGGILIKILHNSKPNLKSLINFWIKRWFRTLPAYYFTLFLLIFALPLLLNGKIEEDLFLKSKYAIFTQNIYSSHPRFFPEAWSLSIEEWFYIITPCILFLLCKKFKPKKSIIITITLIIVSVTLFRYFKYTSQPIDNHYDLHFQFRKLVVTRLDSLMYGILGAFLFFYYSTIWFAYKKTLFWIGLFALFSDKIYILFFGNIEVNMYLSVFQMAIKSIATLLLIPYLSSIKTGKGILFKIITFISAISYSMYLLNMSVVQGYLITYIGSNNMTFNYIAFWCITILSSYGMYKLIEMPFLRLRDKVKFN